MSNTLFSFESDSVTHGLVTVLSRRKREKIVGKNVSRSISNDVFVIVVLSLLPEQRHLQTEIIAYLRPDNKRENDNYDVADIGRVRRCRLPLVEFKAIRRICP